MRSIATAAGIAAGLVVASQAGAFALAQVDINGDDVADFDLNAGTLSVFGGPANNFRNSDVNSVHFDLNEDGVVTRKRITVLLAETSEGLAWMNLFDSRWDGPGTVFDIGFSSQTTGQGDFRINNPTESGMNTGTLGSVDGDFRLRSGTSPDAFAWTNLAESDEIGSSMQWAGGDGLIANKPIQFVTWDAAADEGLGAWKRLGRYNFTDGNFSIDATMGPTIVPAPGALAVLGLAGLLGRRRRR